VSDAVTGHGTAPVDRGVARRLDLRDALLLALAFSAGLFEAICFLSFGKVFTAFQTGNVVFLGLVGAGTRPPLGPEPVTVVVSLVAFAAGAALAMPVLRAFDGEAEIGDDQVVEVWSRRVSVVLALALAGQVAFLLLWLADRPSAPADASAAVLVALSAAAMGLQMNAVRRLHVPGVSTTAATATYVGLVSGLASRSLQPRAAARLAAVLVCIVVGALVGDLLLDSARAWAPVPAVAATALVVAVAWVSWPGRPPAPPGTRSPATSSGPSQ
jgi:uncharacterized membrane protein YoaK (UPF0700 family)